MLIGRNLEACDCGIVATHNALVLSDKPSQYAKIREIAENQYDWSPYSGMPSQNIPRLMRYFGISIKWVTNNATISNVCEGLRKGKIYVIMYALTSTEAIFGHAAIVRPDPHGMGELVNPETRYPDWMSLLRGIESGEVLFCTWVLKRKRKIKDT